MATAIQVKQLRDKTGASMMVCKKALDEARGDQIKAIEFIQSQSQTDAEKKAARETKQGLIEAYIHSNGKVGVILQLYCESDFVAKNQIFKTLAHDLAMHIAANKVKDSEELLIQQYIKNPEKTVKDLINEHIIKLGENIKIGDFIRLEI